MKTIITKILSGFVKLAGWLLQKKWISRPSKMIFYLVIISIFFVIVFIGINVYIRISTSSYIKSKINDLPVSYTALVLGAKVNSNDRLSAVLRDRVDSAIELFRAGKIKRFLLSGDHGQHKYDEVNAMKKYLLKKRLSKSVIFLDHAGFNTYNSIVRAKKVFLVSNTIIVTQNFHLPRAIFIARKKGLNAFGYSADKRKYYNISYLKFREFFANIKAFLHVIINRKPRFLGKLIPIDGDSLKSWD